MLTRKVSFLGLLSIFCATAAFAGDAIPNWPAPATWTIPKARIGINGIVVRGSRDVEFFYLVHGVRRAYRHWNPIQENEKFFVPKSPESKLPTYLSERREAA